MILLAALLVAVAAAMVLLGVSLGGLGWLYGALATATVALVVLASGVVRELRHRRAPDGHHREPHGDGTPATGADRDDADPGAPPP